MAVLIIIVNLRKYCRFKPFLGGMLAFLFFFLVPVNCQQQMFNSNADFTISTHEHCLLSYSMCTVCVCLSV